MEDYRERGSATGNAAYINNILNQYMTGARAYFNGDMPLDGKYFQNSGTDISLRSAIYQLYKPK